MPTTGEKEEAVKSGHVNRPEFDLNGQLWAVPPVPSWHERKKTSRGNQPRLDLVGSLEKIAKGAQRLVAGTVGGGGANDHMVKQFHFKKLAGTD